MSKNLHLEDDDLSNSLEDLQRLHQELNKAMQSTYDRSMPFSELISDRWKRAKALGFGEGSSIYDSSYVYGNVEVGKACWFGPNTVIDGSGKLSIGNSCTISIGAQIYSHSNVKQTLTGGEHPIEREETRIGNNVYVGPNAVITKGVTIGNHCVIGAFALVNKDIPDNSIVIGQPGKVVGSVSITDGQVEMNYL